MKIQRASPAANVYTQRRTSQHNKCKIPKHDIIEFIA